MDTREWRHFKELTKTVTPIEEDMFHLHDNIRPQVYLRPKETVHIPFKYQTFLIDPVVMMQVRHLLYYPTVKIMKKEDVLLSLYAELNLMPAV